MDALLGMIILWPVPWVPAGWLPCDGRSLAVADYKDLSSLLGTTYGGDGVNSFNLPDLRGMVVVGVGTNHLSGTSYILGAGGGQETTSLTTSQLPSHMHSLSNPVTVKINASNAQAFSSAPTNVYNTLAAPYDSNNQNPILGYNNATPNIALNTGSSATVSGNTGTAGGGQPFSNLPPYLVLNYIIATHGEYPQQS